MYEWNIKDMLEHGRSAHLYTTSNRASVQLGAEAGPEMGLCTLRGAKMNQISWPARSRIIAGKYTGAHTCLCMCLVVEGHSYMEGHVDTYVLNATDHMWTTTVPGVCD